MLQSGTRPDNGIYLSIVTVGRNDNYGGDFNHRLNNCFSWTIRQLEKNRIPSEIIFVNYNFIKDSADISTIVNKPGNRKFCELRFINIPSDVHDQFINPDLRRTVPVYEYIAKNIGIQRARGTFILAANPDIIIHPAIFRFICQKKLSVSKYYRTDRCDFHDNGVDISSPEDTVLKTIGQSVFRYFLRGYTQEVQQGKPGLRYARLINRFRLLKNINMIKIESVANYFSWPVTYDYMPLKYHTNCSGDFMLLHRDQWHRLRGYPENTYLAMHTDSIFVLQAAHSGLKEFVFHQPVYHQDHSRRYQSDGNETDTDIQQMFDQMNRDGSNMEKTGRPIVYNNDSWGCSEYQFSEKNL